ncbi:MAG: ubiquinone/menaquinone biosynthesis methyltransferase [Candidatus Micrarchaeia archaeon]
MEGFLDRLFSSLSSNYDRVSKALSFGFDSVWRAQIEKEIADMKNARVLDVATGTGSVAIDIARKHKDFKVTGIDFNKEMLGVAREKSVGLKNVRYVEADAESLSLADGSFDAVVSAFSLGNFNDAGKAIEEMHRVLSKGGRLVLLDMSKRRSAIAKKLAGMYYYARLAPALNNMMRKEVEEYIHSSYFEVDANNIISFLKAKGFSMIRIRKLGFGAAFIITAVK